MKDVEIAKSSPVFSKMKCLADAMFTMFWRQKCMKDNETARYTDALERDNDKIKAVSKECEN